jgi:hypothetical protein
MAADQDVCTAVSSGAANEMGIGERATRCGGRSGRSRSAARSGRSLPGIGGQQLTDYWFYVHRRWVFDLVLSNPDAVKLYRMSPGPVRRGGWLFTLTRFRGGKGIPQLTGERAMRAGVQSSAGGGCAHTGRRISGR